MLKIASLQILPKIGFTYIKKLGLNMEISALDADLIIIDWEKSELFASGITDSLGNITGNPIFKEGATSYEIRKEMRYNFKSQKAIIKDVVTEQQDGLLRGQTIKKDQDGSIYLDHGYYTTCNLAEPHWHINAAKIKSIRGNQVVTGPFNLYFNDIPYTLGFTFWDNSRYAGRKSFRNCLPILWSGTG
jgi:hypothetical protein